MPPDLSLRGPNGAVAISGRQLRFRRSLPVIHHCTARFPRRFAPRYDTSVEREVHQRPYAVKWACTWRSLTAATDAIGLCVLSIPNTNRRCTAGRDMSLPYNAWPKARELFILHFSVFSIHSFLHAAPCKAPHRPNMCAQKAAAAEPQRRVLFSYASPRRGKVTVTVVPVPRVLSSATRAW